MITIEVKFENEADKESFITSVVNSFNSSGKEKSVHANTVERSGDTLFFTRKMVDEEAGSYASVSAPEAPETPISAPETPISAPSAGEADTGPNPPSVPRKFQKDKEVN